MYEFCPEGFQRDDVFEEKLKKYREYTSLPLLWIENPQAPWALWRCVSASYPGCVQFGQYRIYLGGQVEEREDRLVFQGEFACGNRRFETSEIVLSLAAGELTFSFSCPEGVDCFQALDAGIRYIMPWEPASFGPDVCQGGAAYFSNPFLSCGRGMTLEARICPWGLLNPKKTFITLPQGRFSSCLCDRFGRPAVISPEEGASLVLERSALTVYYDSVSKKQRTGNHSFYLSYSGAFRIEESGADGAFRIEEGGADGECEKETGEGGGRGGKGRGENRESQVLLGLYGMEYMDGCDRLTFLPGHCAFLGEDFSGDDPEGATAPWLSLCGTYYSMPESTPLYRAAGGILQAYECPAAEFIEATPAFPYFPWLQAEISKGVQAQKADDILYSTRCKILGGAVGSFQRAGMQDTAADSSRSASVSGGTADSSRSASVSGGTADGFRSASVSGGTADGSRDVAAMSCTAADSNGEASMPGASADDFRRTLVQNGGEDVAVTPGGLCVCVERGSGIWKWLGLAQTSEGALPDVRVTEITPYAKQKLLQKDCFIVISSAEEFRQFWKGRICLEADGWEIFLSPEEWDSDTILILKYCRGESVEDRLVGNSVFKSALDKAYDERGEIKNAYEEFMRTVTSRDFEGMLMLNARVRPENVSPEIGAVMSMAEGGRLCCVYASVKRSRVSVQGDEICVMRSQVDGFLSYESRGILQTGADHDFSCRTVSVEILIQNTRMTGFASRTEILPGCLAGEVPVEPGSMILAGRQDIQDQVPICRFALEGNAVYEVRGSAVEKIEITSVSLSADGLQSRFLLGGYFVMKREEACDIFSYDRLAFEGISVEVKGTAGRGDYSDFRIRNEKCEARKGSLGEVFGAVPEQYVVDSGLNSPDEMGYQSITAPVPQGEIGAGWNGVVHRILLGSSGSLGADEPLSFRFLTAWKGGDFYFGVRLEGVFSRQFSLQNLLGVEFRNMSLVLTREEKLLFQMNSLTLRVLGLSFPPKSVDAYLFGEEGKVGWFFGYAEKTEEKMDAEV